MVRAGAFVFWQGRGGPITGRVQTTDPINRRVLVVPGGCAYPIWVPRERVRVMPELLSAGAA